MKKIKFVLSMNPHSKQSLERNKYFQHLHTMLSNHKQMLNGLAIQEIDSLLTKTDDIKKEIFQNPQGV